MILRVGSWPRTKAGNATEAQIDLRLRGGTVMISRLISPRRDTHQSECDGLDVPVGRERGAGRNDWKGRPYEAVEVAPKHGADESRIFVHDFVSLISLLGGSASPVSGFSLLSGGCVGSA